MNTLTYAILDKGPFRGRPAAILNLVSSNIDTEFFLSKIPVSERFQTKYSYQWRPFGALILYVIPNPFLNVDLSSFTIEALKVFGKVVIEVDDVSLFYVPEENTTIAFSSIQNQIKFPPKNSFLQFSLGTNEPVPEWVFSFPNDVFISPKTNELENVRYVEQLCLSQNFSFDRPT